MSTPDDAPKPDVDPAAANETAPEGQDAPVETDDAPLDAAADALLSEADSALADATDTEPSGWGKGTIAAIRKALGGGENADVVADEITKLVDENADLKDRMLRMAADMENLRKRTEREKGDTAKYAVSKFAEDMLRVGDNLGRALESVPENTEDKDAALKSLRDGIAMTGQELVKGLERHGVVKDEPKGEAFDPNKHQAIAQVEDDTVPAGMISEVFQIGYMISDRVLRPAMVVVSKGPAASETPVPEAPTAANDEAVVETPTAANDDAPADNSDSAEP